MQYVNINTIGDYPEDFLMAKVDVERYLIDQEIIEKRMKLDEFILYLNIQEHVYMNGQRSIAFKIIKGMTDTYIFYSMLNNNDEDLFKAFQKKLELMKYNLSSLKKVEPLELLQFDISKEELFMINFIIHK